MTSELSQAQVELLCEAVPAKILTSLPRINKTGFFACPKFIAQCASNLAGIKIQHDAECTIVAALFRDSQVSVISRGMFQYSCWLTVSGEILLSLFPKSLPFICTHISVSIPPTTETIICGELNARLGTITGIPA